MSYNPQTFGTVGGAPITGDVVPAAGLATKAAVTLTANYDRSPPPGWPRADAGAPVASSLLAFPQTIPSGTTLTLFEAEASALVAANAATYV